MHGMAFVHLRVNNRLCGELNQARESRSDSCPVRVIELLPSITHTGRAEFALILDLFD
jgi:hypothetical protein